ncbi:MAG: tyrosine-type recombinase/integrase [Luteolibacter sp.]
MATLIKRPGSPFWFAAFDVTQPDGTTRRLKKSTKKKKRGDALIEAIRIEEAERKLSASTDEGANQAFSILTQAAAAAARGELSEARARDLIARLSESSTGTVLKFYTVRTWTADWLAMKAVSGKKATMDRYTAHVGAFVAWLGDRADGKLESITKADIRAFRAVIRKGWKPPRVKPLSARSRLLGKTEQSPQRTAKTTNHYASDVAGMFRAAVREGLLLASPAAALDKLPEDDSTEREVFNIAEVAQLVNKAGDPAWQALLFRRGHADDETRVARCSDWQGMILAGYYAGPRLGDCARLTEGTLDLSRKLLSFSPAKTERKRKRKKLEVPLHPRLVLWLETRELSGDPKAPLFPSLIETRVGGNQGLSAQFTAIMDAAGVDRLMTRERTKEGQRAQHARSFHALRHSLTSALANADVSEEIRRRIVGHESADVHKGYTHHERETLARAIEKMPSL